METIVWLAFAVVGVVVYLLFAEIIQGAVNEMFRGMRESKPAGKRRKPRRKPAA